MIKLHVSAKVGHHQVFIRKITCCTGVYIKYADAYRFWDLNIDTRLHTLHKQPYNMQGYSKWLSGFYQLVIHNTLDIGVCSCTDGSRNSQSFLLWCAVCSTYAFLRLERSLLRWGRTANHHRWHATNSLERTQLSCWCLLNHKGCTYRAPIRYVTKTRSVVLLNKKYIYCYLKCIVYDKFFKPRR